MSFCSKCGKELMEGAVFCGNCGAAVEVAPQMEQAEAQQVLTSQVYPADPVSANNYGTMYAEEKECLDDYHKLLKWERISWSISGKVFLVITIIFAVLFSMMFMISLATDEEELMLFSLFYLIYPLMFLPFAIVNIKMVKKVQYYMDTLYTDIRPTATRCESIGMIVLCYFFNTIAMIFYIINFARTKGNKGILNRIIAHQQEGR